MWYCFTLILWHATSYSCSFRCCVPIWDVRPGKYIQWLYLQHRSGPTGVSIVCVSQQVAHWMNRQSFDSLPIRSHLTLVVVEPRLADVEKDRKMTMKRSGKTWGIYSQLQVRMKWVTANWHNPLKVNHAAGCSRWQGFPTALQFEVSWSNVVCFISGLNSCEPQPTFPVSRI